MIGGEPDYTFSKIGQHSQGMYQRSADLILKSKDGMSADVIAIELKNPNGSNVLSIHQE